MGVVIGLGLLTPALASAADVVLLIDGVDVGKGAVMVAFCDRPPVTDCRQHASDDDAKAETVGFHFTNIPPGRYAFVGGQDFDRSGDIERNFLGMPQEPFAIGAPDTQLVPPPTFEDIAIDIEDGKKNVVRLTLRTVTATKKKKGAPVKTAEDVPLKLVEQQ
jgi:uncharacterized protein (DUF2141 family)